MATKTESSPQAGGLAHLLKSYTSSHPLRSPSPLPPSSRVDPTLAQRTAPPTSASPLLWTLPTWLAFAQFALAKGLHIIWSLVKHLLVGPKRKSWGYRMTFITSFMRNVANYTDFADIVLLRRLISITYFIPLPADAVVTPITFVVPKRRGEDMGRGFLYDWDLQETGTRELTGEWVVNNDVWKRLKSERRARWHAEMRRRTHNHHHNAHNPSRLRNDSSTTSPRTGGSRRRSSAGLANLSTGPSSVPLPPAPAVSGRGRIDNKADADIENTPTSRRERVIYYVHGGAYYVGNAATHRLVTVGISKACNARVFAITYRLAPEAAFPLPLLDVLHGYLRLLAPPLSIPPENIVVMGDSAGGGLSLALCMYLRDNGYQLPSGLVLMSPWVDLTMSCGSWDENADSDVVPGLQADDHLNPVGCYLGPEGLGTYLTHPYASPLFGDLHGLPPMLIQSGDSEVLRDEITLLAHKLTLSGVQVTHELYEDMVHVFQMFTWLPATGAAINSVGRWVRQTLPRIEWEEALQAKAAAVAEEMRPGTDTDTDSDAERAEENDEGEDTPIASSPIPRSSVMTPRSPSTPKRQRSAASIAPSMALYPPTTPRRGLSSQEHLEVQSPGARPNLRRSVTTEPALHSDSPTSPQESMRRRRTAANLSLSMHTNSPVSPNTELSPTPSRRRMRSRTISSHPPTPSTRTRSASHTDIFDLVDSYVEGGAANATVVYGAGGEIRSVGVLGDEE